MHRFYFNLYEDAKLAEVCAKHAGVEAWIMFYSVETRALKKI